MENIGKVGLINMDSMDNNNENRINYCDNPNVPRTIVVMTEIAKYPLMLSNIILLLDKSDLNPENS